MSVREQTRTTIRTCRAEGATAVIGGYWKISILQKLGERPWRFGELGRALGDVTARTLTRQLRELEEDGLVHREVHSQVPPKVEYSLTEVGRTVIPLIRSLEEWIDQYVEMSPGP